MSGPCTGEVSAGSGQEVKRKAAELAALCGMEVCVVGYGPDGEPFFWPDDLPEVRRVAETFLEATVKGGGSVVDKKRKRAEVVVGDMGSTSSTLPGRKKRQTRESGWAFILGADALVGAEESIGDNFSGEGAPGIPPIFPSLSSQVDTESWVDPDGGFDLLETLNAMCSTSLAVMPENLSEPPQMGYSSAASSTVFAGNEAKKTTSDPEMPWAVTSSVASTTDSSSDYDDGEAAILSSDADFDLTQYLNVMRSPSPEVMLEVLSDPLQMGPPLPPAAADLSSSLTGLDMETTPRCSEPLRALQGGIFSPHSASFFLTSTDFGSWDDL